MKTDKKKETDPGSSSGLIKKRRGVTLKDESDVRRYLLKLIKAHLDGEMSADSLRASTYALNSVLAVFVKVGAGKRRIPQQLAYLAPGGNDDTEELDDSDDSTDTTTTTTTTAGPS